MNEVQDPIPCLNCQNVDVLPQQKDCKNIFSSLVCNQCHTEIGGGKSFQKFKENYIKNEAKKWKELPLETLEMLIGFYKYGE